MIGFVRRLAGGDIRIDNREIEAAGWFTQEHPAPLSLEGEHHAGAHRGLNPAGGLNPAWDERSRQVFSLMGKIKIRIGGQEETTSDSS